MKLKAITAALAGAGMLALVSGSAQAGAMAGTAVELTNFGIYKDAGATTLVTTADLLNLSFTSTMDMQATLNGATTGNISASTSTGPGIDQPATCIGTGCNAPINFFTNNLFPAPAQPVQGNYAAVDQLEVGSPISGLTGYVGLANVSNAAYVGLATGSGSATTTSNNNLQASWTFVAGYSGIMTFDFDLRAYLQAFLDSGEIAPTFATANWDVNFTLECLEVLALCSGLQSASISPNPLGGGFGAKTVSRNSPAGNNNEFLQDVTAHFNYVLPVAAGSRYQLSARINTLADLERYFVPEPGILALLGLGLLGLGATLRKKAA